MREYFNHTQKSSCSIITQFLREHLQSHPEFHLILEVYKNLKLYPSLKKYFEILVDLCIVCSFQEEFQIQILIYLKNSDYLKFNCYFYQFVWSQIDQQKLNLVFSSLYKQN